MDNVKIVMRQTNYSKEEAEDALEKYNNNVIQVIENYMDIQKKEPVKLTTNQGIYAEIRELMSNQRSSLFENKS